MYYFIFVGLIYSLLIVNVCFIIWLLGLGLIIYVLFYVVNMVYICYVMDKDVGVVIKLEVYDVYMLFLLVFFGDNVMLVV